MIRVFATICAVLLAVSAAHADTPRHRSIVRGVAFQLPTAPAHQPAAPIAPTADYSLKIEAQQRVGGTLVRVRFHAPGQSLIDAWLDPPIEDFDLRGDQLVFATPLEGEYTLHASAAAVVGGQLRTAHAQKTFRFLASDSSFPARLTADKASRERVKPEDVIRDAALAVDTPQWAHEIKQVADRYRSSASLAEADQILAKTLPAAWKPFLGRMEQLFDRLHTEGMLPTAEHEQSALAKAAEVLEQL